MFLVKCVVKELQRRTMLDKSYEMVQTSIGHFLLWLIASMLLANSRRKDWLMFLIGIGIVLSIPTLPETSIILHPKIL